MLRNVKTADLIWKDLEVSCKELRLDTLRCGQSFRWRNIGNHWSCVLRGKLYVLKETPSTVLYGVPETDSSEDACKEIVTVLRDYFQLDRLSLEECYKRWSDADANFKKRSVHFQGIRMLRQDPWENLVSFICSSNNNIARITQMIQKLCQRYGPPVIQLDGVTYHDFPFVKALAQEGVEDQLRQLGFGYRAKYIAQTARYINSHEKGESWLMGLRSVPYAEAKEALVSLSGVGPKVADCVCLMSLDHHEAIPVDTHVWQIALRDYGFGKKQSKTLTSKVYDQVADHLRQVFGQYSGWAHSVLFTADLRAFEDRLTEKEEKVLVSSTVTAEKRTLEATVDETSSTTTNTTTTTTTASSKRPRRRTRGKD